MRHPGTDTIFPGPWWAREEQTAYVHVPLMTGTRVSHNPGILVFEDNPVSCVQADDNGNMSSALTS